MPDFHTLQAQLRATGDAGDSLELDSSGNIVASTEQRISLLSPFNLTPSTPGFIDPPGFVGPLVTTIPSGVMFQAFAVEVTSFNQTGLVEIITTQPTAPLAQYHVGLYSGSQYNVVQTEPDKEYAGTGSMEPAAGRVAGPRWTRTVASTPIYVAYYSDASAPTQGSLNVYVLMSESI